MPRIRKPDRRAVFGALVFLFVTVFSAPSDTSVPSEEVAPPTPEEIAVLMELSEWLVGDPSHERFLAGHGVSEAIRSHSRGFELFRRYNGKEANRRLLAAVPYGSLISRAAERHRIDSLLVAAVVEVESSFDAQAISPRGAVGLMQVTPGVGSLYGEEELLEPSANLEIGSRYFASLLREFEGDLQLALAAYNAGPASVVRFGGVPPYAETRAFVDRVLTRYVAHHQSVWADSPLVHTLFAR